MAELERVYRDTDSGGWGWETRAQSGGSGSQSFTDVIVVQTKTGGVSFSGGPGGSGYTALFADFEVIEQKGTDLSIGSAVAGRLKLETADGGTFAASVFANALLTADPGDTSLRLLSVLLAGTGTPSDGYGIGADGLFPLADGVTVSEIANSMPYVDLAAGSAIGGVGALLQAYLNTGDAGDVVTMDPIILMVWKLASL